MLMAPALMSYAVFRLQPLDVSGVVFWLGRDVVPWAVRGGGAMVMALAPARKKREGLLVGVRALLPPKHCCSPTVQAVMCAVPGGTSYCGVHARSVCSEKITFSAAQPSIHASCAMPCHAWWTVRSIVIVYSAAQCSCVTLTATARQPVVEWAQDVLRTFHDRLLCSSGGLQWDCTALRLQQL